MERKLTSSNRTKDATQQVIRMEQNILYNREKIPFKSEKI